MSKHRITKENRPPIKKEPSSDAWEWGLGMAKVDGGEPSAEFLELVERHKRGEISFESLVEHTKHRAKELGSKEG